MRRGNRNFCIVIPSHVPWDFPTDYVQKTASVLSQKYQVLLVDVVEPLTAWQIIKSSSKRKSFFSIINFFSSKKSGLFIFRPVGIFPFQRFRVIYRLNLKFTPLQVWLLLRARGIKRPLLWLLSPLVNEFVGKLGEGAVVYDVVDFWRLIDPVENARQKAQEDWLLSRADVVFANSSPLAAQHRRKNKNIQVVPCGCDTELFRPKRYQKPKELARIRKPIIGQVGHLDHRLDFPLLEAVINDNKDLDFVFIGPVVAQTKYEKERVEIGVRELQKMPNTHFLGKKPKEELPNFIKWFDVGIVPYDTKIPFVAKSNPMKVYEYLAMGKPVVATEIEALKKLNPRVIKLADNPGDFSQAIRYFIKNWDKKMALLARKIALSHSWEAKVGAMEKLLIGQGIL